MRKTSKYQIIDCLQSLRIPKNKIYVIHSSLLPFGIIEGGVRGMMDCIWHVLGPDPTILMPTFTFSFGKTRVWSLTDTRSETGVLTEHFRVQNLLKRTVHPFHSLSASGPHESDFLQCECLSSFGGGSPFDVLSKKNAYNIAMGVGFIGGASFVHHAEEVMKVPYRFYKEFPGLVALEHGIEAGKTFKMFCRRTLKKAEYVNDWSDVINDLTSSCIMQNHCLHGSRVMVMNVTDAHDFLCTKLQNNPYYMAKIQQIEGNQNEPKRYTKIHHQGGQANNH